MPMFLKIDVLKNFQNSQENIFTGIFLKKLYCSLTTCNFLLKEILAEVFSCEFREFFKNTFFYRTPMDDCYI